MTRYWTEEAIRASLLMMGNEFASKRDWLVITEVSKQKANFTEIRALAMRATGVGFRELISPMRDHRLVRARHMISYLARRFTKLSFPEIAERMHRDHSSIIHGARQVVRNRKRYEPEIAVIERLLESMPCERPVPLVDSTNKANSTPLATANTI